jgi:hypothetical protein
MKGFLIGLALVLVLAPASLAGRTSGPPEFVTICHVAGLASDPANQVTLTLPVNAVYGQAGHFNENGTPNAGHEQDYLGACTTPEEPPVDPPTPPTTPPSHCAYTGAGKDGQVDAYGGTNDDCAPLPPATTPEPQAPVCKDTTTVITVEKIVPKIVKRTVTKWRTKIVYRTKVRVVVKHVKVYVPGLHPDGVEGQG